MNRQEVLSSQIHSVGYDNVNNILEIVFKGGKIYQYKNVPEDIYEYFMTSKSKGRFFHEKIKKQFTAEKGIGIGNL